MKIKRSISYLVPSSQAGRTIREYLLDKGYSSRNIIQLKEHQDAFLVNGAPRFTNYPLWADDKLTVRIYEDAAHGNNTVEKIEPVELPLSILYEDEDFLVVNKPAGMPIHPSMNNYGNTLANALAFYYQEKKERFVFRCVNRLDKDTSGLTIIAKHIVSAGILSSMVSDHSLQREYRAVVRGRLTPEIGMIKAPIGRKPGSVIERCIDWEHGEQAITHYCTLAFDAGYSLLAIRLATGRTHQIRVHMQSLGHPLAGDFLYAPGNSDPIERQALHSCYLEFSHPMTGGPMRFKEPLPADMVSLTEKMTLSKSSIRYFP